MSQPSRLRMRRKRTVGSWLNWALVHSRSPGKGLLVAWSIKRTRYNSYGIAASCRRMACNERNSPRSGIRAIAGDIPRHTMPLWCGRVGAEQSLMQGTVGAQIHGCLKKGRSPICAQFEWGYGGALRVEDCADCALC